MLPDYDMRAAQNFRSKCHGVNFVTPWPKLYCYAGPYVVELSTGRGPISGAPLWGVTVVSRGTKYPNSHLLASIHGVNKCFASLEEADEYIQELLKQSAPAWEKTDEPSASEKEANHDAAR